MVSLFGSPPDIAAVALLLFAFLGLVTVLCWRGRLLRHEWFGWEKNCVHRRLS